jgi:AraC-like DNA-binding protein
MKRPRPPSLLARYPCFETRDPDECAAYLSQHFRQQKIDAGSAKSYDFRVQTAPLDLMTISEARSSQQQVSIDSDDRFYFLLLGFAGGAHFEINGRKFTIGPGDGLLSRPIEQSHSGKLDLVAVAIPSSIFDKEAEHLIGHPPPEPLEVFGTTTRESPVWAHVDHFLDRVDRPGLLYEPSAAWQHMLVASIIEDTPNSWASLIRKEERIHNTPYWHRRRFRRAEEYMEAHLCDDVSVENIAAAVGCGRRALEKSFVYCGKKSPREVFREKRLEAMMQDLNEADPNITVESAARKYNLDPTHVVEFFLQKFGRHPREVLLSARAKRGY